MDFFDSPYFSINKTLLKLLGVWPYQSRITKNLIRSFISLCVILFCAPHVRRMYEKIGQNWKMTKGREEATLLLEHAKYGKFLTVSYLAYMLFALIAFITMPMLPFIIDKINPLNVSRPKIFILQGEYLVDPYKHYQKVYIFETLTCILSVIVFSAMDSTYVVCVQQCIALMDVVKIRLNVAKMNIKKSEVSEILEGVAAHDSIVQAVRYHQKAINFANTLEHTYAFQLLFVLSMNASIFSVGSVIVLMNLNNPMELIRFSLILLGLVIHIFYISWPGQQMINISSRLLENTYENKWYDFSSKTQKILLLMMIRCQEPCQFTAGGIYVMNVANCGAIIKASFSYITVFSSMI